METLALLFIFALSVIVPGYFLMRAWEIRQEIKILKQVHFIVQSEDSDLIAIVLTDKHFIPPEVGDMIYVDEVMRAGKIMPRQVKIVAVEPELHTEKLFYCRIE